MNQINLREYNRSPTSVFSDIPNGILAPVFYVPIYYEMNPTKFDNNQGLPIAIFVFDLRHIDDDVLLRGLDAGWNYHDAITIVQHSSPLTDDQRHDTNHRICQFFALKGKIHPPTVFIIDEGEFRKEGLKALWYFIGLAWKQHLKKQQYKIKFIA